MYGVALCLSSPLDVHLISTCISSRFAPAHNAHRRTQRASSGPAYKDVGVYNDSYMNFNTRFPNKTTSGCYSKNFTSQGVCRDNMGRLLPALTQAAPTVTDLA